MADKELEFNENEQSEEIGKTLWDFVDKFTADEWREIIGDIADKSYRIAQLRFQEKRTISWPIFGLIAFIFLAVSILAFVGNIEGHYVTSLGGVIVGYLLSFLGETVTPPNNET